jgi:hypothetical protein
LKLQHKNIESRLKPKNFFPLPLKVDQKKHAQDHKFHSRWTFILMFHFEKERKTKVYLSISFYERHLSAVNHLPAYLNESPFLLYFMSDFTKTYVVFLFDFYLQIKRPTRHYFNRRKKLFAKNNLSLSKKGFNPRD